MKGMAGTMSRTTINFLLDAALLATFSALVFSAVIVRFIFPPGQLRFPEGVTTGIFDRQYRVVVEVIDAFGNYARDEELVIAHEPDGWSM